jgi:hypothetical protein
LICYAIIFLGLHTRVCQNKRSIAFDGIGTHPIENHFGLTWMQSMDKHTYVKLLWSLAGTTVLMCISKVNNCLSPAKGSFSIGECKVFGRDGTLIESFQSFELVNDFHCLVVRISQSEVVRSASFQEGVIGHLDNPSATPAQHVCRSSRRSAPFPMRAGTN